VIDDHAHPFRLAPGPLALEHVTLDVADAPEAAERRRALQPAFLWHALLTERLARHLGVPAAEVAAAREAAAARDYRRYVRGLFGDVGITEIVMDPGWPPGPPEVVPALEDLTGCRIHRLLRLDTLVDRFLERGAGYDEIVREFDAALAGAETSGYRGLKTIIAYRTGLAVDVDVSAHRARRAVPGEGPLKRRAKALRDFLLLRAVEFSADTGMPFQFHTGLGDSDLRLGDANPLLLEDLLRTPAGQAATIVLIHGAYPFHEEAAYLAASRPNVHVDFSLCNLYAPARLADRLLRIIELAPYTKVLMATDGFDLPETFWFAATMTREAWDDVRGRLGAHGAPGRWIDAAERAVFEDNARRLYRL
jgi:hypothetical protein